MDLCGFCRFYKPKNEKKGLCTQSSPSFYVNLTSCIGCPSFRDKDQNTAQKALRLSVSAESKRII